MKKYILTLLFALMAAVAAQAQSYEHFQENLKEAKAGNRLAQYNVGLYYHNGWSGVKQDYQQAAYWYRKSADQGYADAQLNLGYLYEKGLGVSQDSQQAVYWYRKAAEQGNVSAMFNLGSCYHDGNGVTQDCQQAVYWSRKAAEQGHGAAMCRLGNCYYEGECVDQDYQQAVYWYRKAADQGVSSGMNSLGHCYKDGNGVTQDYQQAVYWYRKADEQGSAAAKYNLAVCYYYGEGVGQDYEKAYELTLEALEEMDDPEEMALPYNLLAIFYDNGQGVAKDGEMAEELYKLAISYGSMEAKANLGGVYYNKGDYTEAFPLLSDAAADGLNSAQYLLGCMYRSGSGVTKNENIAIRWYKLAAAQGHEKAIACLDDMYFDEEAPEAFDWVKKRAQEGDAYSQYRLGKFYMEGTVVEQDYDEAKKWLDKAAQQDNDRLLFFSRQSPMPRSGGRWRLTGRGRRPRLSANTGCGSSASICLRSIARKAIQDRSECLWAMFRRDGRTYGLTEARSTARSSTTPSLSTAYRRESAGSRSSSTASVSTRACIMNTIRTRAT